MKNKLYIISHTHWDREWYMSFETHRHNGSLPQSKKFIELKGDYIRSSALKLAEDGNGTILRLYNVSEENQNIDFTFDGVKADSITNLAENEESAFSNAPILPKKIMTYRLKSL